MDKTQDIVIMIGYGPLLGGLLLVIALLAGSLYTQQGKVRGPLASLRVPELLKEAQVTESDGVRGEGSVVEGTLGVLEGTPTPRVPSKTQEDRQDAEDQDSAPHIRYRKYCHDLPKEYCCDSMKRGIEGLGFIEYYQYYDEYSFSSYNGYPLATMRYCPFCGKEIPSLRSLFGVMKTQYMRERGWDLDQIYRYWGLYRRGKSQEEAERIAEQEKIERIERIKSKSRPPM